jgi:hypothetical protein
MPFGARVVMMPGRLASIAALEAAVREADEGEAPVVGYPRTRIDRGVARRRKQRKKRGM